MAEPFLAIAQAKVSLDQFELSQHAQKEAAEEQIGVDDIRHAILTGQELEPYPQDPRGPSCLMVGQDFVGRWIHVLCGNFDHENLLIITVYLPRMPKWQDPWTRLGKK
jgi:hypothetical protein